MKIGLDYDKTYSADPLAWLEFIVNMRDRGHEVRIVTIRDERYDRTQAIAAVEHFVPIIWTRGTAKKWFCAHFVPDFQPEIWIDDKPETIFQNSDTTPEDLAVWRAERGETP